VRSEATSRARAEGIAHQRVNTVLLREVLLRERGSFSSKPERLSVMIVLQRFECKPNVRRGACPRSTNRAASAKEVHACRQLRHVHPARCPVMV
jgi:hypothetical protein